MNYKNYTLPKLKEICASKNLDTDGKKNELIKRLTDNIPVAIPEIVFERELPLTPKLDALYIQSKASNLSHYFNSGIIYPLALEQSEVYKNDNRKNDIFSSYPEHIILVKGALNGFLDEDVLIEIITNELDLKEHEVGFYYSEQPISISRVKRIIFSTTSSKETFLSSVETFPDFFLEPGLCEVSQHLMPIMIDLNGVFLPKNQTLDLWTTKLGVYDKILGLFSFFKNSGVFFAESENLYQEYTPNYFAALGTINTNLTAEPTRESTLFKYIFFPFDIEVTTIQRFLFKKILNFIYQNGVFNFQVAAEIINEALNSSLATLEEKKEMNEYLREISLVENRQLAFSDILINESIRKNYPVLALLFLSRYPNKSRQHTDKQALRNVFANNSNNFGRGVSEFLLAVLGLYYGYSSMIKEDTNLIKTDSVYRRLSESQQSIKFRLSSTLERFTIESIFNFSKNSEFVNANYTYLNLGNRHKKPFVSLKSGKFTYTDESKVVLNTPVTIIKRKDQLETLMSILDKTFPAQLNAKSLSLHYVLAKFGISKELFSKLLKEHSDKINIEELSEIVEMEFRISRKS